MSQTLIPAGFPRPSVTGEWLHATYQFSPAGNSTARTGEENVTENEVCRVQRRGINSLEAAAWLREDQERRINSLEKALDLCEAQNRVGSRRYRIKRGIGAYLRRNWPWGLFW